MGKNLPANAGDSRLIPESGRSPGKEMATPSSTLAWESHRQRSLVGTVHGVAKEVDMA